MSRHGALSNGQRRLFVHTAAITSMKIALFVDNSLDLDITLATLKPSIVVVITVRGFVACSHQEVTLNCEQMRDIDWCRLSYTSTTVHELIRGRKCVIIPLYSRRVKAVLHTTRCRSQSGTSRSISLYTIRDGGSRQKRENRIKYGISFRGASGNISFPTTVTPNRFRGFRGRTQIMADNWYCSLWENRWKSNYFWPTWQELGRGQGANSDWNQRPAFVDGNYSCL